MTTPNYSLNTPSTPTIDSLATQMNLGGGSAIAASAPSLAASLPAILNPAAAAAGIAGTGIMAYLDMKEQERQRKLAERQLALQEERDRFEKLMYREAAPQRAVNLSASAIPVANMRANWNERLALLRNSVGIKS